MFGGSMPVRVLRRNVGHQRAIAVGLTYLYAETDAEPAASASHIAATDG